MSSHILAADFEYLPASGNFDAFIYEKVLKEENYITSSFIGLIFFIFFQNSAERLCEGNYFHNYHFKPFSRDILLEKLFSRGAIQL